MCCLTDRNRKRKGMMKMGYIVKMNNQYMNSFKDYTDACELRDRLQRQFKKAIVEIEPIY